MNLTTTHEPILRTKMGYEYPNGVRDPDSEHTLHLFDCSCGHQASVWYASEDRARASWERHASTCQNPYCDGTGWVLADATATARAYRTPACQDEAHRYA